MPPYLRAAIRVSATAQYPNSPTEYETAVKDDELFTYCCERWSLIGWSRIIGLLLFIRCHFESDWVNPNPDYTIVYKLWIRRVGVETLQPRVRHHPDAVSDHLIQTTLDESISLDCDLRVSTRWMKPLPMYEHRQTQGLRFWNMHFSSHKGTCVLVSIIAVQDIWLYYYSCYYFETIKQWKWPTTKFVNILTHLWENVTHHHHGGFWVPLVPPFYSPLSVHIRLTRWS